MSRESLPRDFAQRIAGRNLKVIGLGGIGSAVAQALVQFLSSTSSPCSLWLVDGDVYQEANRSRVRFEASENKALSKANELSRLAGSPLTILPVVSYVTPRNVRRIVEEDNVIFLCVDNHATRRLVSNRCQKLENVLLLSGGNDGVENGRSGTFGNVMVYLRREGRDATNPLTRFHPEIARPSDRRPDELGCAALAQSSAPQLLFTNLAVASAMLGTFYGWLTGSPECEEVYLDIGRAKMTPVLRKTTEVYHVRS